MDLKQIAFLDVQNDFWLYKSSQLYKANLDRKKSQTEVCNDGGGEGLSVYPFLYFGYISISKEDAFRTVVKLPQLVLLLESQHQKPKNSFYKIWQMTI